MTPVHKYIPKVRIVPTTAAHIRDISEKLRREDRAELLAIGNPNRVLWRSYKRSFLTKTAFIDGKIVAIWGVGGTPMGMQGEPWLMTTPAINRVSPLAFAKLYQKEVLKMLKISPLLVNHVDSKYTKAIRLLDIVGFSLGEPEPMGVNGELFIKFEMKR